MAQVVVGEASPEIRSSEEVHTGETPLDFDMHASSGTILPTRFGGMDGGSEQPRARMMFNWVEALERIVPTG